MAELVLGLDSAVRRARVEKEARFWALLEDAKRGSGSPTEHALAVHRLMYPTLSPEELRQRRERHGSVKWTAAALAAVAAKTPLVEIGAGRGQWQKALSELGADVLAFDDMSSPAFRQGLRGKVQQGNEAVAAKHTDRALLLVYPNPGPMAVRCLENYRGETLVYVGEGRGGVNGDDSFFDRLGREWSLDSTVAVDLLPDCHERVWVLRRTGPQE